MKVTLKKALYSKTAIKKRVAALGKAITKTYKKCDDILVVPLLEGGTIFAADLIREINLPLAVKSFKVSSYHGGTKSSGKLEMDVSALPECKGKHVIIVDDIYDTGLTISTLKAHFKIAGAKTVISCVLLNKKVSRHPNSFLSPDLFGFEIKNEFVVGYGLDYNEVYRNLPYIAILDCTLE
jgi:hypoxanthine phosphoribosyltransferase